MTFDEIMINEYSFKHHKRKKKKHKLLPDFDNNELKQYKMKNKEKAKLFIEASDCDEIKLKHHHREKKKKSDSLTEEHTDFNADEFTPHKNKKDELFIATSDYDETKLKHLKKKKKKCNLLAEAPIDFNEDELTPHKSKKDELFIVTSDYDETKLKHHKKKKKEKPELHAELDTDFNREEFTQQEKKKTELFIGTTDYNNTKLKHHKKKKKTEKPDLHAEIYAHSHKDQQHCEKKKSDLLIQTYADYDETKQNHSKKKKKKDLLVETFADYHEIKQKMHKKKKQKKSEFLAETSSGFNEDEPKQHKKKKEKIGLAAGSLKEFQSEENTDLNLLYSEIHAEPKLNFDFIHKHKKRHKGNNLNKMEVFTPVEEGEIPSQTQKKYIIPACVSESNISSEDQTSVYKKKQKKLKMYKDKSYVSESLKKPDFMSEKQKTEKCQISTSEVNSGGYEFEINYRDCHKKKKKCLNVADASTVIDEPEVFSKKPKKRKKDSGDTEPSTIFNQHLNYTEIDISDILLEKDISHLSILNNDKKECNYVNNDLSSTFHSLSNDAHNHSPKKRRHLKNATLIANKFNDENPNCEINKECEDVGTIDYTKENLKNSAGIRNSSCAETLEYTTYFSSDIDCSEDPVDFEIPPLHKFETVCRLTEKQKADLLASDVFIKTGKFTTIEDKIIQRNFEYFAKKYGVSDPFSLFGIGRYQKDLELLKFLKVKHFYVRLAKDLNDRSLHSVYKRARKILHPYRTSGKLTEKEIEHLKRLHENYSNKWNIIGDTLGSTAEGCAEAYRWHKKNVAKGQFTEEEKDELIEALKKVSGSSDISCKNIKDISWETVASCIPSRNNTQCRMYWANNLAWSSGSARKKWNEDCYRKLVYILKDMNVENSSMIDWYKVYESFEDFAPSDLYVLKRWLYIRSRIPDYKNKSHKQIVNILCNKYSL